MKQALGAWYARIDTHLLLQDFVRSENEATLYLKLLAVREKLLMSTYVDNLLITRNDDNLLLEFKDYMQVEFEMSDLGLMNYFLSLEVYQ